MKHQKLETTPEISKRMSHVKLKRGEAETLLAKALWHRGIRYEGTIVLFRVTRYCYHKNNVAIFVDGEFWRGYDWKRRKQQLKSNREYCIVKIEENIVRDKRNDISLEQDGWIVIYFRENR